MTPKKYLQLRDAYSYPAVGLLNPGRHGFAHRSFATVTAMEKHFGNLLVSPRDIDVLLGYINVLYWGHYSANAGFALSKVRRALTQLSVSLTSAASVAGKVRAAHRLILAGKPGDAAWLLMELPQLKFAFASKVCAFLAPDLCGVIDSVIAKKHRQFEFVVHPSWYIKTTEDNIICYTRYCQFLVLEAARLNVAGISFHWHDRDGEQNQWRAVDIERALYSA